MKFWLFAFCLFWKPMLAEAKDITTIYSQISPLGSQQRILKSTEFFRETPSGNDPLGEGGGLDPDPTYSTKIFDCTTYVETNLAIAFSKSQAEIPELLNKIRYASGEVDFFQRNHFMVSDWIPANTRKGFVSEITGEMTPDKAAYKTDKKSLKKTIWFFHRVIDLLDQQKKSPKEIQDYLAKVPVLPLQEEKATYLLTSYFRTNEKAMIEKLPDVSIVMFIRNIPSVPTLVNHMGFIIKKGGKLFLNHAPLAKPWKIQELALEDYFKEMDSHRAPIEGLLLFKVSDHNTL